jgi:hypothetical protein
MCFANSILQVMLVLARAEGMSKEFTKLKRKQTIKARLLRLLVPLPSWCN